VQGLKRAVGLLRGPTAAHKVAVDLFKHVLPRIADAPRTLDKGTSGAASEDIGNMLDELRCGMGRKAGTVSHTS
jgi:hypothetical protein